MQFFNRGVRALLDQPPQPIEVDLDDRRSSAAPRRRLAGLTPTLLHPTRPRRTHLKNLCDLFGFHPAVVSRKHPIPKVLTIRNAHPRLLPGPLIEPARNLQTQRASRNPNRRRTRYDWIDIALTVATAPGPPMVTRPSSACFQTCSDESASACARKGSVSDWRCCQTTSTMEARNSGSASTWNRAISALRTA